MHTMHVCMFFFRSKTRTRLGETSFDPAVKMGLPPRHMRRGASFIFSLGWANKLSHREARRASTHTSRYYYARLGSAS